MKHLKLGRSLAKALAAIQLLLPISQQVEAALSIPNEPLFISNSVSPIVMLNVSRDHQLFYKAYNDYSDLDQDGTEETTYKHSFSYYGYFDPKKCYDYSPSDGRFNPASDLNIDGYCSGNWHGNFLNWVSMARVDIMRKVLFGGYRSTDTATLTVLERAHLPADAHSWAKFYNGPDIDKLTPFSITSLATYNTSININNSNTATATISKGNAYVGDQLKFEKGSNVFYGTVVDITSGTSVTISFKNAITMSGSYTTTNLTQSGISFCNTTYAPSGETSHSTTQPPIIRATKGNYALWAANEKWQCYWSEEKSPPKDFMTGGNTGGTNGNRFGAGSELLSGISASSANPSRKSLGLLLGSMTTPDYIARVKVCDSSKLGTENCKLYGTNSLKPVGLLQKYGEGSSPSIYFGMITGSFTKNISGGVLRKNANHSLSSNSNSANDEIDPSTGVFKSYSGIISNLSKLRVYGFDYGQGWYNTATIESCNYQQIGIVPSGGGGNAGDPANEGNCSSWGNPISEMYVESLRYLAGKPETNSFSYSHSSSKDEKAGLGAPVTWSDPINTSNYCAPLNVLNFNASVSSYDTDQVAAAFADFGSLSTYTDAVGLGEGINNASTYMGGSDGLCTAKTASTLSQINGICPEAPALKGGFGIAGAAYFAHTNPIRSSPGLPTGDTSSYKVNTYGVALATNVPRITIPINGTNVVIQPTYRLDRGSKGTKIGTGAIVDFKIVSKTTNSGKFYIAWEDSNQGGDYDQDIIGLLDYTVSGNTIKVATHIIAASGGGEQGFGYTISGTNKDGPHFHSGIYKFTYNDSTNISVTPSTGLNTSGGCQACDESLGGIRREATYTVSGANPTKTLEDPLYYASKWGGFKDNTGTNSATSTPDATGEWDATGPTGATGPDGLPDNYFYVNNPGALEQALSQAFSAIAKLSSASAVATSSTSLQTATDIYQANFNPSNWTGELTAYSITQAATGQVSFTKTFDVASKLKAPNHSTRTIVTHNTNTRAAIPFRWSALDATQQAQLQISAAESATVSEARLNYIRGDSANEGPGAVQFRARPTTTLGDIIDSSPMYVGLPVGQYASPGEFYYAYQDPTYYTFQAGKKARNPVVYVGANDGMLHGFYTAGSDAGKEALAYIPSAVYQDGARKKFVDLADQSYTSNHRYFVNGSPAVADAQFASGWKTVLVSGMGQGGRGVFALNVSDPSTFNETNAAQIGLWEFLATDDPDVGHISAPPIIAKLNNGKWAAIFSNGYNGNGDKAALFIALLDRTGIGGWTGNYIKLVADSSGSNALFAPSAFDRDGDGNVDYIYAGDLKGNLWKFDISDANDSNWTAAKSISLLVTACTDASATCDRQPITTPLAISRHPLNLEQAIIYFGTGKYLETADKSSAQKQAMYGVWDKGSTTVKRSDLLVQTITNNGNWRTVTDLPVDWTKHSGWVEDLPDSKERHTGKPYVRSKKLYYNTFIPSVSPCEFGGSGYQMIVKYHNGGQGGPVFDTDGNYVVNSNDSSAAGYKVGGALGGGSFISSNTASIILINTTNAGSGNTYPPPDPILTSPESNIFIRTGWRELLNQQ